MNINKEIEKLQERVQNERKNGLSPNIEQLASSTLSKEAHEYWFMVRYWLSLS